MRHVAHKQDALPALTGEAVALGLIDVGHNVHGCPRVEVVQDLFLAVAHDLSHGCMRATLSVSTLCAQASQG